MKKRVLVVDDERNIRTNIKEKCFHLLQINQNAMFAKSSAAQKISTRGSGTLITVALLVMIIGILLSWGLSRRIVRPILQLKEATKKLAAGDYNIVLNSASDDELGILTTEFTSSLGTVGITIGVSTTHAPNHVIWIETIGMLLGRLEFYVMFLAIIKFVEDLATLTQYSILSK